MTAMRRGVVLLEVLCALTLLTGAGVALVRVVTGYASAAALTAERESQLGQQTRLLLVHQLMTSEELADRAGIRYVGDLTVDVTRIASDLVQVTVSSRRSDAAPPLTTFLYTGN